MLFTKFNNNQFKTQIYNDNSMDSNSKVLSNKNSNQNMFGKSVQSINGVYFKNRVLSKE